MERPGSRRFALGFIGAMILLALALVGIAERSVRSRETWSMVAHAERTEEGWRLKVEPSREVHLYAIAEDEVGALRLLFPLSTDASTRPIPGAKPFECLLPTGPDATLLVLADPRPLWSLEEARSEASGATGPGGPPLELDAVLAVRGLGPLQEGSSGGRVSLIFPPASSEPDQAHGLWARRFL